MLRLAGTFRLRSRQESEMTNQDTGAPAPNAAPQRDGRRGGRGTLWVVLALAAGLVAGGVLSTAFAQGYGWHPGFMGGGGWHHGFMGGGWHHAGFMGGPLNPAQIEERIDRMTKHMAIELDATAEQQANGAGIAIEGGPPHPADRGRSPPCRHARRVSRQGGISRGPGRNRSARSGTPCERDRGRDRARPDAAGHGRARHLPKSPRSLRHADP